MPVAKVGEEDEDRVFTAGADPVTDLSALHPSNDEPLGLELAKTPGKHPGGQARVAPEELAESRPVMERHVPQEQEGPFVPETPDAFPQGIGRTGGRGRSGGSCPPRSSP